MADKSFRLQPAVKLELKHVITYSSVLTLVMWLVFLILHLIFTETVPFDYTVILGALGGDAVAVLNFFLMALMVQKVAGDDDKDRVAKQVKLSYTRRYLMQIAWMAAVVFAPCFNLFAGLLPLLFPTLGIKAVGLIPALRVKAKTVSGAYADSPLPEEPSAADDDKSGLPS